MQAYLDNKSEGRFIGTVIMLLLYGFAALGVAIAALVLLGWMPLGERANILRGNLNYYEIIVIIASTIYAVGCARTANGIRIREKASQRWSQWMLFITTIVGGVIILSVIIPIGLKLALLMGQNIDARGMLVVQGGLAEFALLFGESLVSISLLLLSIVGIGQLLAFISGTDKLNSTQDKLRFIGGIFLAYVVVWIFLIAPAIKFSIINYAGTLFTPVAVVALLWFFQRLILEGIARNAQLSIFPPSRRFIYTLGGIFIIGIAFMLLAGSYIVNLPEFQGFTKIRTSEPHRIIAGVIFFFGGFISYLQVRRVKEQSDELRRAVALTPGKFIRSELAKSPSAGAIIGFIAIFIGFTMATDLFLEPSSIASFLSNVATKGVIAIGVTYLMISGEFDLSVGSILGVTALSFMLFMTEGAPVIGVLSPFSAAFAAILVAALLGAINGIILITTRIPSFIVTLGTLLAFRSITLVAIAGGRILRYSDYYDELPIVEISNIVFVLLALIGLLLIAYTAFKVLPDLFKRAIYFWAIHKHNGDFGTTSAIIRTLYFLSMSVVFLVIFIWLLMVIEYHGSAGGGTIVQVGFFDLTNGRVIDIASLGSFQFTIPSNANIRLSILWWFIFVVIFHIILTSTSFGNSIFATGGNAGAARAQGINVDRVKVQNFVIVAVLTGIAAIYETARNPGVDPLKGQGWELDVIAMTVIGGALLTGGYGSVVGSLLGALIFGMLQTGLVLVGIESRLFTGTVGVIIIVAVILNTFVRGARRD